MAIMLMITDRNKLWDWVAGCDNTLEQSTDSCIWGWGIFTIGGISSRKVFEDITTKTRVVLQIKCFWYSKIYWYCYWSWHILIPSWAADLLTTPLVWALRLVDTPMPAPILECPCQKTGTEQLPLQCYWAAALTPMLALALRTGALHLQHVEDSTVAFCENNGNLPPHVRSKG